MQKIFTTLSAVILIAILMIMSGISPSTAQTGTDEAATASATATAAGNSTAEAAPTEIPASTSEGSTPEIITVSQYSVFEAQLPVETIVKNVYDPTQLQVNVVFTAPDGKAVTVPAFWMQPYHQTCTQACTVEVLQTDGTSGWRVRFTPNKPGQWTYELKERDSVSERTTASGSFTVTPSNKPGFIRVGKNGHYFGYDNGTPYFPVGTNLGWSWSGANGTLGYIEWLKKLKQSGVNYARLYIDVPWFIGLGWKKPIGDFGAAQEDGWRLDTILQTAEELNIGLQLVLVWYQGYSSYTGLPVQAPVKPARPDISADWTSNPLSAVQGGPLAGPALFFADDATRNMFKRRLRYIAARWGYSTSVFAWELIDQLDRVAATNDDATSDWLKDMTNYLRDVDAHQHLITAGLRDYTTKASLLERAVLDFKETRYYQRRPIEPAVDQVGGTLNALAPLLGNADRPVLLSEFSLSPWFEPTEDDPTGVHIRQSMWASALSGAAGSGASWWWDTYLFPQNLTPIFAPIVNFTKGVPWNTATLTPITVSLIGDQAVEYNPLRISGYTGTFNGPRAPDVTFRITPDGIIPPVTTTSSYLYGVTYNAELAQPQKYIITPPVDTILTIGVNRVSERGGAELVVSIDGKLAGSVALAPSNPPIALTVPISAGEHVVVIDNVGADYLQIDSLSIAQYITPLRTMALADRRAGIFLAWLQHRDYTWENVVTGTAIKPISASLRVDGMAPGQYLIEFWDPFSGNVVGDEKVMVAGETPGVLSIDLLPISSMLAVRAFRVAEPANLPTITPTFTSTPRTAATVEPTMEATP